MTVWVSMELSISISLGMKMTLGGGAKGCPGVLEGLSSAVNGLALLAFMGVEVISLGSLGVNDMKIFAIAAKMLW